MGYQSKVQVIEHRGIQRQFSLICPAPLAQALEMEKGETIEWIVEDKWTLTVKRVTASAAKSKQGRAHGQSLLTGPIVTTTPLIYRPHQEAGLDAIAAAYQEGINKQLIIHCTGSGKSTVFANIKKHLGLQKRVLLIAHRKELIYQAANHFRKWNPEYQIGIEMASEHSVDNDTVVIGSVQTLGKESGYRIDRLDPQTFDLVIIDETHRAIGESYENVLTHFGISKRKHKSTPGYVPNNRILLVGFTATGLRSDKVGLGTVFDRIVHEYPIFDLDLDKPSGIRDGWLVDVRAQRWKTGVDISHVPMRAGELATDELSKAINIPTRNHLLAQKYREQAQGRPFLAFAVDVDHAKSMAEVFNEYGIKTEAVWGNDPDRDEKLKALKEKRLDGLTNCQVFTEGVDIPNISCILLGRPFTSSLNFIQVIGRGLRTENGINIVEAEAQGVKVNKKDCLVIDVLDSTAKHKLCSINTLFGLPPKADLMGQSVTEAADQFHEVKKKNEHIDFGNLKNLDNIDAYVEEVNILTNTIPVDLLQHSKFGWYNTSPDTYLLDLAAKGELVLTKREDGVVLQGLIYGAAPVHTYDINQDFACFRDACAYAETMVKSVIGRWVAGILSKHAPWRKDPADAAMKMKVIGLLKRYGVTTVNVNNLTKDQASTSFLNTRNRIKRDMYMTSTPRSKYEENLRKCLTDRMFL